ncbi:MAG: hypothetical protein JNK16_10120 [Phycisphaerales bacterium]|nr:hypothetical protein [Phycisphaerales bacterium]
MEGHRDALLEEPVICLRCGYELRGLLPSSVCPECALPIADSLAGRRLGLSSPAYLATLRGGAVFSIVSLVFFAISGIARWQLLSVAFAPGTQRAFVGIDVAAACLLITGVWMLTIDDPGLHMKDQARPNKRAMRGAAIGLFVLAFASFIVSANLGVPLPRLGTTPGASSFFTLGLIVGNALASLACWLTLATGLINYTRWLAVRVPDLRLLGMVHSMSWLIPCVFVLAFIASPIFGAASRILPLTFMAVLIGATRERLKPSSRE